MDDGVREVNGVSAHDILKKHHSACLIDASNMPEIASWEIENNGSDIRIFCPHGVLQYKITNQSILLDIITRRLGRCHHG